jgi:hypothetical protein
MKGREGEGKGRSRLIPRAPSLDAVGHWALGIGHWTVDGGRWTVDGGIVDGVGPWKALSAQRKWWVLSLLFLFLFLSLFLRCFCSCSSRRLI